MDTGIALLAQEIVSFLGPNLPWLVTSGATFAAGAVAEDLVQSSARGIWARIQERFSEDRELSVAQDTLAQVPESTAFSEVLQEVLLSRLTEDPELTQELAKILHAGPAYQEQIAKGGTISDSRQKLEGSGTQKQHALDKGKISNSTQTIISKKRDSQ